MRLTREGSSRFFWAVRCLYLPSWFCYHLLALMPHNWTCTPYSSLNLVPQYWLIYKDYPEPCGENCQKSQASVSPLCHCAGLLSISNDVVWSSSLRTNHNPGRIFAHKIRSSMIQWRVGTLVLRSWLALECMGWANEKVQRQVSQIGRVKHLLQFKHILDCDVRLDSNLSDEINC
jgi:hypothetical protein